MLKSSLLAKLCNCKDSLEFAIIQAGFGQIDNSLTVRMHYFNLGTAKGEILLCIQWDLNYTDLVAPFRPSGQESLSGLYNDISQQDLSNIPDHKASFTSD